MGGTQAGDRTTQSGVTAPPAAWWPPALGGAQPAPVQAASRGIWKDTRPKPMSS